MKKSKRNFLFKLVENGRTIQTVETHSKTRFMNKARSINWKNRPSVYLRVSYGKQKDHRGKLINFYNDGIYDNNKIFSTVFQHLMSKRYVLHSILMYCILYVWKNI